MLDLLTCNDQPGRYPPSFYAAGGTLERFGTADENIRCDVCVIGGGFTGLSSALHLAQRGYDVVLLEAQRVGFGASGRNGGQVGHGQHMDQRDLEKLMGKSDARKLWDVARESVDLVREISASPLVHAKFHDGIIHADHRSRYVGDSHKYVEHLQNVYDHSGIRALDREELRHLVGSPMYYGGYITEDAGHIDPFQLVLGLARMAVQAGVRIFERTRVTSIQDGQRQSIGFDGGAVDAEFVVMGCNGYLGELNKHVAAKVMPINNFIAATAPLSPEMQESLIRNNHAVADSNFVINYYRFSDDNRLLFGGGESYGYHFPADISATVRKPMERVFPQISGIEIDYAWGGTLGITMNRMPHFEKLSSNILSSVRILWARGRSWCSGW